MAKNAAVPVTWFVIVAGAFIMCLPDGAIRDGLLVADAGLLLGAAYAWWRHYKGT